MAMLHLGLLLVSGIIIGTGAMPVTNDMRVRVELTSTSFLSISADRSGFEYNGKRVFLSGVNEPWISYGADFGNNQSNGIKCQLEQDIVSVAAAGGNAIRMWLFVEGASIPAFDSTGHVTGAHENAQLSARVPACVRLPACACARMSAHRH